MSDGEEHIFHNGFHATRKMNKLVKRNSLVKNTMDPRNWPFPAL